MKIQLFLDKYIVIGNLIKEPNFKTINTKYGEMKVCNFSLMIGKENDKYRYINIKVLGKVASQIFGIKKGMILLVIGTLNEEEFTDKKGEKKKIEVINANFITCHGCKSFSEGKINEQNIQSDNEDDLPF
jgi:single-stranded DNA-binding protein